VQYAININCMELPCTTKILPENNTTK